MQYMKQLAQIYTENLQKYGAEFIELAPQVLKLDSTDYELRLHLVKYLMA